LSPAAKISKLVKTHSPDTLIVLDAVCAVASEEIKFDEWGLDVVISATQKGLGVPPGLSVVMASDRAIKVTNARSTPVSSYYINWQRWQPIMQAYEAGQPKYFATRESSPVSPCHPSPPHHSRADRPAPVQLVYALNESLKTITQSSPSFTDRLEAHKKASAYIKDSLAQLGLDFVPLSRDIAANGMTAVKYPKGLGAADILPKLVAKDIVVAGGLHKAIATEYFRIGHMGVTAVESQRDDLERVVRGIKEVLDEVKGKSD
jgi:alanine-glyoxylate transaminase/serine-glyoxylate transaminase/serine-pyruvate transaminase